MTLGRMLADELKGTREWTLKLVADLSDADWGFQPAPGLPHALWLCGHTAVAENALIHQRCANAPVLDAALAAHFAMGSEPAPLAQHDYPSPARLLEVMADLHARTLAVVSAMTDAQLAEPALGGDGQPHPHYADKRGAVAHCSRHEAFHAGQIATIRRLLGRRPLR